MSGRKTMTGREKSKSAIASERKNMECAADYVSFMEDPKNPRKEEPDGQRLGRVLKALGGGRLEVQFADGTTEKPTIAKKIRFHGRAATKGDQLNCMSIGDLVIVDGGFIFGKLVMAQQERVETVFNRKQMEYPQGFFAKTAIVEEQGVDDIVEWDRSGSGAGEDGGDSKEEEEEDDVITMGPATAATKPAKGPEKPAKADEWTGRRGGKREDTGDLDIDNI
jgi:translation initiation factor IF-1